MRFAGQPWPEPWASNPGDDWPFHSAGDDVVEDVRALYVAACDRSRAVAASRDSLDARAASPSFGKEPVSLRWVLVHMIVETAQHIGHVELLHDAARAD